MGMFYFHPPPLATISLFPVSACLFLVSLFVYPIPHLCEVISVRVSLTCFT